MFPISQKNQAILWMLLANFLTVSVNTIAKSFGADFSAFQMVFFYNLFGLLWLLPFIKREDCHVRSPRNKLFFLRSVLEFAGFASVFFALEYIPLPTQASLGFTSPIFSAILAIWLLKEQNSLARWISLVVGFAGVLVVTQPWNNNIDSHAWMVIFSSLCFAGCGICIRKLASSEKPLRITFYMLVITSIISLPFALLDWHPLHLSQIPLLLLMGAMVTGAQTAVSLALHKGEVTLVLPFTFAGLIWASLYGWLIFGQTVGVWTYVGAAMILSASIYVARHTPKADTAEVEIASVAG